MIKGQYTYLRAIEQSDLVTLMNWRNKPQLRKYFRETDEINIYNQTKWFESISAKDSKNKMFAIVDCDTDNLIGACGLCYLDWINKSADFSIYIGYKDLYIDSKYAIDAANIMIEYGFSVLNLHRMWAEIYSIDEAKKAFFDKLKFTKDGVLRETYWYDNCWHDSIFYSLLRTDVDG
jgi:RimJ/RimL family protein N-acetyltransferase